MKVRSTFLCLAITIFAVAPSRGQAPPYYGPQQPAHGPIQPGSMAPVTPAWARPFDGYARMPYGGAPAFSQFASHGQSDDAAAQPGNTTGKGSGSKKCASSDCLSGGCAPPCRIWADFELLCWWREGRYLPTLVTTSDTPPVPLPDVAGTLDHDQTVVIFGGDRVTESPHGGARFELGVWIDPCATLGIGVTGLATGEESEHFSAQSDGAPILARPFFNTTTGTEAAQLVAYPGAGGPGTLGPGAVTGSIDIFADNEIVGCELFLRKKINHYFLDECAGHLMQGPMWLGSLFPFFGKPLGAIGSEVHQGFCGKACITRTDLIGGYQYTRIRDSLTINNTLINQDPTGLAPVGLVTNAQDLFYVRNEFHGGNIGLLTQMQRGRWKIEALGKIGVGNTHMTTRIAGQRQFSLPGVFVGPVLPSGLLAQPSNNGTYDVDRFTLVPEARLKLKYQVNCHLDLSLGYTFIYWSRVALAGQQVNLDLSGATFPQTGPDPTFTFNHGAFWAQGIDLGLRICY
jgi:hypothetical protein